MRILTLAATGNLVRDALDIGNYRHLANNHKIFQTCSPARISEDSRNEGSRSDYLWETQPINLTCNRDRHVKPEVAPPRTIA